ncbi:hypothetical protein LJ656_27415 [Paraburkholderia sp. MMS20-SJTR3]|uniref:Uncharacterized protein n=1 Tax=Paraburkholderia sejongensis TaxID=2886946 RepID=A0ABS8K350_9BURK|nr:hypothetical protein [Paraburkholderia sp. MMS20-SJTR3]MCC8396324.1 hypothetical protein [Paraburkholderia sp. MMS20-SJTR3]
MVAEIPFSRAVLYEEVWADPLSAVSKRYGLSDNGLRKICIKLGVPFPPVGYWAKLRSGQKVTRTPLPQHDGPTIVQAQPDLYTRRVAESEIQATHRGVIESDEARPERHIAPVADGEWRHRLIKGIAKRLNSIDQQIEVESRPRKSEAGRPKFDRVAFKVTKPGGLLDMGPAYAAIVVTPATRPRALSIADAFFVALEARGFKITLRDDCTVISCKDVVMQFRMSEMAEKSDKGVGYDGWHALGRLRITLRQHGYDRFGPPDMRARDEADGSLEEQLNELAGRLRRAVFGYEKRELARKADSEWAPREEALRQQKAWHEQMASEAAHREKVAIEAVFAEADLSEALDRRRHYLDRLEGVARERGIDVSGQSSVGLWLAWARAACDSRDPRFARVDSFTSSAVRSGSV